MLSRLQSAVHWEMLAPAALLLLFVLPFYHGTGEFSTFQRRNAEHPSLRGMARAWQNWVDLLRAAFGALLLENSFTVAPGASPELVRDVLVVKLMVLGLALLMQVVRFQPALSIYAPSFFLTGLTPTLSGPIAGGFAVLFGWLFVVGTRDPRWLLPVVAGVCGMSAYVFGSLDLMTLMNMGMLMAPLGIAFLLRRFPLHLCRGLRPAVPGLTNTLTEPEFRRVQEEPAPEPPSRTIRS